MKISKLIEELEKARGLHGDIEVTMQATAMQDGSGDIDTMPDVFESTIETAMFGQCFLPAGRDPKSTFDRIRLYWQM